MCGSDGCTSGRPGEVSESVDFGFAGKRCNEDEERDGWKQFGCHDGVLRLGAESGGRGRLLDRKTKGEMAAGAPACDLSSLGGNPLPPENLLVPAGAKESSAAVAAASGKARREVDFGFIGVRLFSG